MKKLLVIDLEATCDDGIFDVHSEETIEIGCAIVDTETWGITNSFQQYIRPINKPLLSAFCTTLTGITQSTVDQAPTFPAAITNLKRWIDANRPITAWASWGQFDCNQLTREFDDNSIPSVLPSTHIDLKRLFSKTYGSDGKRRKQRMGLSAALSCLGAEMTGRAHSGLDDAINTAKLLSLDRSFAELVTKQLKIEE